jgi:hypothetical protein
LRDSFVRVFIVRTLFIFDTALLLLPDDEKALD